MFGLEIVSEENESGIFVCMHGKGGNASILYIVRLTNTQGVMEQDIIALDLFVFLSPLQRTIKSVKHYQSITHLPVIPTVRTVTDFL